MAHNINTSALIESCDALARRCTEIADKRVGWMNTCPWLFDRLMRSFESHPAIVSITIPIHIGSPVNKPGEAEIGRDGSLRMWTTA